MIPKIRIFYLILIVILAIIFYKLKFIINAYIFKLKNSIIVGKGYFNYAYIYNEIFIKKEYSLTTNLNNAIIFDIGANLGLFSLYLAQKYKNMTIHCFEPVEEIFQCLKKNLEKIKNNNFFINNIGLSNTNEIKEIVYYPYANGLTTCCDDMDYKLTKHLFYERIILRFLLKKKDYIKIKLLQIKDYITLNNIIHVDLCKIDVECSELYVLEGFGEYLHIVKMFIIEIENFRNTYLDKIKSLLKNYKINITNEKENWCKLTAIRN